MDCGEKRGGTGHVLVWLDPFSPCRRDHRECPGRDASRTSDPEDSALPGLAAPDLGYSPSWLLTEGVLAAVALSKGAEDWRSSTLQSSLCSLPAVPSGSSKDIAWSSTRRRLRNWQKPRHVLTMTLCLTARTASGS